MSFKGEIIISCPPPLPARKNKIISSPPPPPDLVIYRPAPLSWHFSYLMPSIWFFSPPPDNYCTVPKSFYSQISYSANVRRQIILSDVTTASDRHLLRV